jgi:MoaA/NifB/PqqE/SkfB family radical SAM enzyme
MKKLAKRLLGEGRAASAARLKAALGRIFNSKKYSVLIDTTNGCNLRCSFCSRNNESIVRMRTDDFDLILRKLRKRVCALQLSCAWEFSIAANAPEIVRTIGKYKIPSTAIYTNGNILTDAIAEAAIQARLNDFVFSIGEAKKETYERLRSGGHFDRVIANVRKMAVLKEKHRSQLPRLSANLTLVDSNIGELPDFVDLAFAAGIRRIIGRHLILNEGLDMEHEMIRDTRRANEIIDAAERKAVGHGMVFSIPRYGPLAPKPCRAPWQQLYVASNGDVSVCPRIHLYENIGNLLTDSLADIEAGERLGRLRERFAGREFANPVCAICLEGRETERPIRQGF